MALINTQTNASINLATLTDNFNALGLSPFNNDPATTGLINEFRIYNQALTQSQVTALARSGRMPAPPTSKMPSPSRPRWACWAWARSPCWRVAARHEASELTRS